VSLLLDIDTCIDLIRGRRSEVRDRFRERVAAEPVGVSAITVLELRAGVLRSAPEHRPGNAARLDAFLQGPVEVLPFDETDATVTAEITVRLAEQGMGIGPYDTQIAGQALRRGWRIVTSSLRHFGRVPGLHLESWRDSAP
jgi:tRNA(fMet)-specific endonuclease VapC